MLKHITNFFEDHPILTFFLGVLLSFLIPRLCSPFFSDLHLRITGVILHVLFIIITIWFLRGIKDIFLHWINKESEYKMDVDSGNYSLTGFNIPFHKNLAPDASLSDKVAHLESEFKGLRSNFTEYSNEIIKEFNDIRESIEKEERSRAKSLEELKDLIQNPKQRNKLNLEFCGFVWLVIGICLRTFSNEISNWFI